MDFRSKSSALVDDKFARNTNPHLRILLALAKLAENRLV